MAVGDSARAIGRERDPAVVELVVESCGGPPVAIEPFEPRGLNRLAAAIREQAVIGCGKSRRSEGGVRAHLLSDRYGFAFELEPAGIESLRHQRRLPHEEPGWANTGFESASRVTFVSFESSAPRTIARPGWAT